MFNWKKTVKGTCVAAVVNCGDFIEKVLISYSGGVFGNDGFNCWQEEIANSINPDDIFGDSTSCPDETGFYVWEGTIELVFDDAPNLHGAWRKATKEDMSNLVDI